MKYIELPPTPATAARQVAANLVDLCEFRTTENQSAISIFSSLCVALRTLR